MPDSRPRSSPKSKYKRVLLKLSGEAFCPDTGFGIDADILTRIASEVGEAMKSGVELAIVIGGGNIFRGVRGASAGMDRSTADYMGMLATTMNALALQDALERQGLVVRVMNAIEMKEVSEPYIQRRAVRHLEKGRVVVFASGTGNPYFTTDTAASLRATEINANIIMKATRVDGIYDRDPEKFSDAVKFEHLNYDDVLRKDLRVMDLTAATLGHDNQIPILVFNMTTPGNIQRAIAGDEIGTLVS